MHQEHPATALFKQEIRFCWILYVIGLKASALVSNNDLETCGCLDDLDVNILVCVQPVPVTNCIRDRFEGRHHYVAAHVIVEAIAIQHIRDKPFQTLQALETGGQNQ